MGRRPNTDQRRRQIIAALLAELAAVGYARASVRSIAARAGLAPGLVHYHFDSKEAILVALVEGLVEEAERRAQAAFAAATPAERLAAFVDARVGLGTGADPEAVSAWVMILGEASALPPVRERLRAWLAADRLRLERAFRAAGAPRPKDCAAHLLAGVLGSFSLHALAVEGLPPGHAARQLHRWLATCGGAVGRDAEALDHPR